MRKRDGQTYDPKQTEEKLYQKWLEKGISMRKWIVVKTFYDRDSPAEHYWTAPYGPCA